MRDLVKDRLNAELSRPQRAQRATGRNQQRREDTGLTLVELMITIIVASLVASGIFAFFVGQKRVYQTQNKILTVQENLWSAMDFLVRYVRASGTGMVGCVRPDSDDTGPDTGDPPPVGDLPPATGLRAFRAGTGAIRVAPLWIQNGENGTPDTITVAFGAGSFGNYADTPLGTTIPAGQPTAALTTLPNQSDAFRPGEFVLVVDTAQTPANGTADRGCTLFQITDIDGTSDELEHTSDADWNPANDVPEMVPFEYTGGQNSSFGLRHFGTLNWVQFTIDDSGSSPRLMMERLDGAAGPQVLAEGIEDLQIAYACDLQPGPGTPDGQPDPRAPTPPASKSTNGPTTRTGMSPQWHATNPPLYALPWLPAPWSKMKI